MEKSLALVAHLPIQFRLHRAFNNQLSESYRLGFLKRGYGARLRRWALFKAKGRVKPRYSAPSFHPLPLQDTLD